MNEKNKESPYSCDIKRDLNKGQHFLINRNIIKKKIKVAKISKKDRIIEIGAGEGILTKELVKKAGEVLAFEIDKKYLKKLNLLEKNHKNLKVICDNALDYSWKGFTKIVSNTPYFLSGPLIIKSIKEDIPEIILIVGERFKNLLETKQTKIGIIANLFYNIHFITKVDKNSFSPRPRVDSWLIKLRKKEKFSYVESLLISIFNKNGKLKNAIIYSLVGMGETKRNSREIIKKMDLSESSLEKSVSRISGRLLIRLIKELEKLK